MAGKHVGNAAYTDPYTHKAAYPGSKENRAWGEGRAGTAPAPGDAVGNAAHAAGVAATALEEALTGSVALGPELLVDPLLTTPDEQDWRVTIGANVVYTPGSPGFIAQSAGDTLAITQGDLIGGNPADGTYRITLGGFVVTAGFGPQILLGGQQLAVSTTSGVTTYTGTISGATNDVLAFNTTSAADAWQVDGEIHLNKVG